MNSKNFTQPAKNDTVPSIQDIVAKADRGILMYDTGGLTSNEMTKKLIRLMKTVMRRNSCGPHWTEELKQFYEECDG